MNEQTDYLQLRCPACGETVLCDHREMVRRLQAIKMLRRQGQPEPELVRELFRSAGEKLACDRCGKAGLIVEQPDPDDLDWGAPRCCQDCGQPIPAERIELFPDARRCAACEARGPQARSGDVPEYCPKCGAVMTLRTKGQSELTRYQWWCESCGR